MKKYLLPSIKMTIVMIVLLAILYPLLIAGIARMAPGQGKGETVKVNGKIVGYARVGQKFTEDKYFWGRPSAVDYNAAGSAGSNKGPSNPDYLKIVADRIDSFLVHNPAVKKADIPSEMVTASGSGLDPDISPASAHIQVKRIAAARNLSVEKLEKLIADNTTQPLGKMAGPAKINVLQLNIALNQLQ